MKRGMADLAGVAAEIVKRGDIPEQNSVRFQGCVRQRILSDGHSLAREEQSSQYEKSQQHSATASVLESRRMRGNRLLILSANGVPLWLGRSCSVERKPVLAVVPCKVGLPGASGHEGPFKPVRGRP